MITYIWWDRKPVYYLCTGSVMKESSIERKIKRVGAIRAQCPAAVNDYQNWMGGVDRHDQLRLQSHSLQMSTKFRKYYTSLFLGFLDMVMVNAYLSHKEAAKIKKTVAMKRSEWFCVLQNQLLQLKAEDFAGVDATPPRSIHRRKRTPVRLTHALQQSEDWVVVSGVQKRRQMSCKICARARRSRSLPHFTVSVARSIVRSAGCAPEFVVNTRAWARHAMTFGTRTLVLAKTYQRVSGSALCFGGQEGKLGEDKRHDVNSSLPVRATMVETTVATPHQLRLKEIYKC
ncbi:hypothetical protein PHMEG_00010000 [Phytophthora megakarya]|uniref:PiggyBac transposable element-derived protein domain-containing protein n=1 Tax=Phytophthora megakarya TaxID=4795 RepID=A0A225WGI0_9STRA|nr:hypothetical protein PHMEG_00010000 [Phytophthora megakarya]